MAVNNQLEGLEAFTCTKTWIVWSFTERMSRVMSPLEPSESEWQTLSKPREELTEFALWPEMRVSKIIAMEGRWEQTISVNFLQKFGLPAPVQFQTSIFIERKLKGLVMWAWLVIHSVGRGTKRLRGCVFGVRRKVMRSIGVFSTVLVESLKQSTLCCTDMIVTASSLSMKGRRIRELSRLRYAVKGSQVWQRSTLKASTGCAGDLHGDGLLCGEFQHFLKQ